MTVKAVNVCLRIRDILLYPVEWLNKSKSSKYFYSTPLPYAIGTCCEDIRHSLDAAKALKKDAVLIGLPSLRGILGFGMATEALFTITAQYECKNNIRSKEKRVSAKLISMYVKIIFIASRIAYLIIKQASNRSKNMENKSDGYIQKQLNRLSFPRLGCNQACDVIYYKLKNDVSFKSRLMKDATNRKLLFSAQYYKIWDEYLRKIGLDVRSNYIVIHTRSVHYHSDNRRREFRNSSIRNYSLMIEKLIYSGYHVVLIGGSIEEQIKIDSDSLYDLRHGVLDKPCSLDVYLVANCSKFIGMQSGPLDVAILFAKKTFVLNTYTPWYCFGYPENTVYILQRHQRRTKDEEKYGITGLVESGIKLIGLSDTDLNDYTLTQLDPSTLLKFCDDFIISGDKFTKWNKETWYDKTQFVQESEFNAYKNKENDKLELADLNNRWKVNAELSKDCVRIYEACENSLAKIS